MSNLLNFIKFYKSNILNKSLGAIGGVPAFFMGAIAVSDFFRGEQSVGFINNMADLIQNNIKVVTWLYVGYFCILNLRLIYKLHIPNEGYRLGLPKSYDDIVEYSEIIIPKESKKICRALSRGHERLSKRDNPKSVISNHFLAYKLIYDFIDKAYKQKNFGQDITQEISESKLKLDKNFNKLKEYHSSIGNNNNIKLDLYTIGKLIEDINDNLNFLFTYYI